MASLLERESSFCDKNQNYAILKALYEKKCLSTFCDVIMKVCGREIYAHSNVLAAASPYFNAFLSQDLPRQFSQRSPQVIEIQIDGSEPQMMYEEAVTSVIDFIYTGKMTVRASNVSQISEIARIMQMDNVVKFCDDFIQGRTLAGETYAPSGDGDETTSLQDACVNTDHVVTTHVDGVSLKLKAGRLVSISCQVTPQLLGIEPRPKQYKEIKTQTSDRDFPNRLGEQKKSVPGRKRGRPRKYPRPDEDVEEDKTSSEDVQATEQNTDKEDTSNMKGFHVVAFVGESEDESEPIVQFVNNGEIVDLNPEQKMETEPGSQSILPGRGDEEETSGLRRSRRTPKPTPKLQGALKRKVIDDLSSKPADMDESVTDEEDSVLVPINSDISITAVRRGRGRPPKKIKTEDSAFPPSELLTENQATGFQQVDSKITENGGQVRRVMFKTKGRKSITLKGKKDLLKYQCDFCGYTTGKVREMTNHRKLHKLEQNMCYYCEQRFENRDDLNEHMEKHKGPTPYFCPVCDLRFRTRTTLNLHLPKHSDDKPYVCEVCSVGFKWKHALKNHMVVHSKKKDHLCDVCGYATAHKSQLKAHKLIHSGQTYKCEFLGCTFQATKRQNLKYHLLTHTREKPHQCEICGQNFSLVKNLRRHMLLHSTEKAHRCEHCEFATTRYDKLKEHLLKQHGFGSPPEKRVRITDLVRQNAINQLIEPTWDEEGMPHSALVKLEQVSADSEEAIHTEEILAIDGAEEGNTLIGATVTDENGESKTMEILPGQTIIITQPGEGGEMQEIAIPVTGPSTIDGETGDINYTEVMIPMAQMAEYVQHVQYVTQ